MVLRLIRSIKINGLSKTWLLLINRLGINDRAVSKLYLDIFREKKGIEIGGPSRFFCEVINIYGIIKSLDGVNFSSNTIWEGKIIEGWNYKYGRKFNGYQYICDATNMGEIAPSKYDFVLSCNNLEHIANPLKALNEMLRIMKPNGVIFLVIPDKESNFDHNRQITSFDHLLEDYTNNVSEEDLTHLDEIINLHDLSMDPPAGDFENFKKRSLENHQNRCLHHHVFDMQLLKQIFDYFNLKVIIEGKTETDFIIVGRKCSK